MKRIIHLLFFLISITYCQGQIKEVSISIKTNYAFPKVSNANFDFNIGHEIGVNLKISTKERLDLVTGGSFRLIRYHTNNKSVSTLPRTEQLFHFKIPIELSYHLVPNKWQLHLGVWSSYLITADVKVLAPNFEEDKENFSTFYFGINAGITYRFSKSFEMVLDYSYSINSILSDLAPWGGGKRIGLDLISFGINLPIKK